MPSIEVLVAFSAASLILNLAPGPSYLYLMARSIAQGSRGGIVAAFGLATGGLMHVLAAVLGLSALFRHAPTLLLWTSLPENRSQQAFVLLAKWPRDTW